MTLYKHDCEIGNGTGVNDGPVTPTTSTSSGNTPATEILLAGNGTVLFDDAHPYSGTYGWKFFGAGGSDRCRARWDFSSTGVATASFFWYWDTLPSTALAFARFVNTSFGGMVALAMDSSNRLIVQSVGGTVKTFTSAQVVDTEYRYEVSVRAGTDTVTGGIDVAYFLGNNSSPVETAYSVDNANVGTLNALRFYVGGMDAASVIDAHMDYVRVDDTTDALLGPLNLTTNFTWGDVMLLSDLNSAQEFSTNFALTEAENLLDQFQLVAGTTYQRSLLDRQDLLDTFTLVTGNNQAPVFVDKTNPTDTFVLLVSNPYLPIIREVTNLLDDFSLVIDSPPVVIDIESDESLSSIKQAFWGDALSLSGDAVYQQSLSSLERNFYLLFLPDGYESKSLSDLKHAYYTEYQGVADEFTYLTSLGFHGSLADMRYQFFSGAIGGADPEPTFLTDTCDFARADSTSLLAPTLGGRSWTSVIGTLGTSGNQAYPISASSSALSVINIGRVNHSIEAKLAVLPGSGQYMGVAVREIDNNNYYWIDVNGSNVWRLFRKYLGTSTQLGTGTGFLVGSRLKLEASGSTLTAYKNGVVLISVTDTSIPSGTSFGLRMSSLSSTCRWDDAVLVAQL